MPPEQVLRNTAYLKTKNYVQVALALKNPFGDDGEDFEIGPLLSRHIWVRSEYILQVIVFLFGRLEKILNISGYYDRGKIVVKLAC